MLNIKKLTLKEQEETAQKIIDSLDGVNYRDARNVLELAMTRFLETSAVVHSSQVPKESDKKR